MLIPTSKPLLGNSIRDCNILPAEIKQFSCSQLLWFEELTWLEELLWPERPENVCSAQTYWFHIAAKCRVLSSVSVQEGRRSSAVWNVVMIKRGFKGHANIVTFVKQLFKQVGANEQTGSSLPCRALANGGDGLCFRNFFQLCDISREVIQGMRVVCSFSNGPN